ncbi:hypothetical protein V5799_032015 [Amblyomma americanum]|uniref:Uncharacterized protein n=1 Tax=Amblyomma americanum TaxID=6943 RepID=A0AAQ4DSD7_AMBAM
MDERYAIVLLCYRLHMLQYGTENAVVFIVVRRKHRQRMLQHKIEAQNHEILSELSIRSADSVYTSLDTDERYAIILLHYRLHMLQDGTENTVVVIELWRIHSAPDGATQGRSPS